MDHNFTSLFNNNYVPFIIIILLIIILIIIFLLMLQNNSILLCIFFSRSILLLIIINDAKISIMLSVIIWLTCLNLSWNEKFWLKCWLDVEFDFTRMNEINDGWKRKKLRLTSWTAHKLSTLGDKLKEDKSQYFILIIDRSNDKKTVIKCWWK